MTSDAIIAGDASREYWLSGLHPSSPPSTTESNAANRLLVSARDAFSTNGYRGTTTRDIAAGAGMSPAAMYIHYASKQEMLFKLCLLGHNACYESLLASASVEGSPRKRLRSAVYDFTHWHAENHVVGRIVQYEIKFLDDENFAVVADVRRRIHAVVENIVRDGVKTGDFDVGNVSATTLGILSLSIDAVRWFPSRAISDPDVLASHYVSLADRMAGASS
ncbi:MULTISPECIES: TetR/AcrR family transcriptional regulator [Rhodococcus]|uniref:TetR/AcrR family transcriptional regulator n=1 Tax=Rhodococcus globerulus TaxID=33008 RepID=UPI001C56CC53|nr:TetR/AcrR family transcriptional regulator [Rhodococcus globerulus]QXW00468.1 TetR/AcrR family transcriptional regulator [Rhodococcus globerulus]